MTNMSTYVKIFNSIKMGPLRSNGPWLRSSRYIEHSIDAQAIWNKELDAPLLLRQHADKWRLWGSTCQSKRRAEDWDADPKTATTSTGKGERIPMDFKGQWTSARFIMVSPPRVPQKKRARTLFASETIEQDWKSMMISRSVPAEPRDRSQAAPTNNHGIWNCNLQIVLSFAGSWMFMIPGTFKENHTLSPSIAKDQIIQIEIYCKNIKSYYKSCIIKYLVSNVSCEHAACDRQNPNVLHTNTWFIPCGSPSPFLWHPSDRIGESANGPTRANRWVHHSTSTDPGLASRLSFLVGI